jgi:hypothetical protein
VATDAQQQQQQQRLAGHQWLPSKIGAAGLAAAAGPVQRDNGQGQPQTKCNRSTSSQPPHQSDAAYVRAHVLAASAVADAVASASASASSSHNCNSFGGTSLSSGPAPSSNTRTALMREWWALQLQVQQAARQQLRAQVRPGGRKETEATCAGGGLTLAFAPAFAFVVLAFLVSLICSLLLNRNPQE